MKKSSLNVVKIDKIKSLFNYEKKILIKELTLDLKVGYYEFEKEKPQKIKFSLEIEYEDKKTTNDKKININNDVDDVTPKKSILCGIDNGVVNPHPTNTHVCLSIQIPEAPICSKASGKVSPITTK